MESTVYGGKRASGPVEAERVPEIEQLGRRHSLAGRLREAVEIVEDDVRCYVNTVGTSMDDRQDCDFHE